MNTGLPIFPTLVVSAILSMASWACAQEAQGAVTFTDDVGPLIHRKCATCHYPDSAAPFALIKYEDVAKRATMIRAVLRDGYMPPWPPVARAHETLVGEHERTFSAEEKALVNSWIKGGKLRGEGTLESPTPPPEWSLGPPDMTITMSEAYTVAAEGPDVYRSFVLPVNLPEQRWIRAIELRPSARRVVHHALFFAVPSKDARAEDARSAGPGFPGMPRAGGDTLGGYAPGSKPIQLPNGLALALPASHDIVMQMHFHPTGKVEDERSTIGLWFAEKEPENRLHRLALPNLFGIGEGIDIPAGESSYFVRSSFELPTPARAHIVSGHAHYLGRSMQLVARDPDGSSRVLFAIDDWDIDWQGQYQFEEPVALPAGTILEATVRFDNSADNPNNPSVPPQRVRWGRETNDEMASLSLVVEVEGEDASDTMRRAIMASRGATLRTLIREYPQQLVRVLDMNGDERLTREELSGRAARLLNFFDRNKDGAIELEELPQPPKKSGPAFENLNGEGALHPLAPPEGEYSVLVFIDRECPIANQYLPELARIAEHYGKRVRMTLVHTDRKVTSDEVRAHAKAFEIGLPIIVDRKHTLAKRIGATTTPEVAILLEDGHVVYRGRIDDRFAGLGDRRSAPTRRDLCCALDELLAEKAVSVPRTKAVGCLFMED